MSLSVSVKQLQKDLPELLEQTVKNNDFCLVERNGEPFAVIVSVAEWRLRTVGKKLDALGPNFCVSKTAQSRIEALLTKKQTERLSRAEQRELKELLQMSDDVMSRRAEALGRI